MWGIGTGLELRLRVYCIGCRPQGGRFRVQAFGEVGFIVLGLGCRVSMLDHGAKGILESSVCFKGSKPKPQTLNSADRQQSISTTYSHCFHTRLLRCAVSVV